MIGGAGETWRMGRTGGFLQIMLNWLVTDDTGYSASHQASEQPKPSVVINKHSQAPEQPQQQQQQPAVETENVLAPYNDNSPILENVRCLYDFKAKTGEELSFRENDELHILGKVENDPEWWVGRDRDGRIGLVPRIYTERVEPEPGTLNNI